MGGIFKSKKGVQTTTETRSAPTYLQPQLEFSAQEARRLYDQGAGGPFVSPEEEAATRALYNYSQQNAQVVSPEEEAATRALYEQAGRGLSPTSLAAQNEMQKTLQGNYLGITPELQKYMDVIARRSEQAYNENVLPSLRAGYGTSGAFGGSDFQQGLQTSGRDFTRELADNLSGVALRNYQAERGFQQNALGLAPSYEQLAYSPALMQQQAGSALSEFNKRRDAETLYKMGIGQQAGSALSDIGTTKANRPLALLEAFNRNLQGANIPGTGVTSTATPYKKGSAFGRLMGGALTLGGAFMGGPMGAQGGQQLGSFFGGDSQPNMVQGYPSQGNAPLGGNYQYTDGGFGNWFAQKGARSWG